MRMPVTATPTHAPLVLIANAQEWVTRSLESILRPAGYAVLKAYSGRDALEDIRVRAHSLLQQARLDTPDPAVVHNLLRELSSLLEGLAANASALSGSSQALP